VSCADCDELVEADSLMSWEREVPVKLRMAESGPMSEKPICVMTALRTTAVNHPSHPALGLYIGSLYHYLCFAMHSAYTATHSVAVLLFDWSNLHCGACRRKWQLTDTDLCPCGETQTMSHIVES